jgi:glycosyltransferase involved in cell wall biosynthesis
MSVVEARRFSAIEHHPVFGGPQNRILRLAPMLADRGWRTLAIIPDEPGTSRTRLEEGGVDVAPIRLHRLRRRPEHLAPLVVRFPGEISTIRRLIKTRDVDVMVVVGIENPHGAIAARMENKPIVWQVNGTQTPMILRRAMVPVVRRLADVVMTTGRKIATEYPGLVESFGQRWAPFFSPVDVDLFVPDGGRRRRAREELGLNETDVVIGTVGNRNPQKGHDIFVRAAAAVKQTRPDLRFVILGAKDESHARLDDDMWRKAEDLGLSMEHDLVVRDPGNRVSELAPAFDIFWFTSVPRSEGVPTVIMEAMALGLPVVATDVGGVTDVVDHGVTGLVVPPLDPGALASRTAELLDDEGLRAEMGNAGRDRAVAEFRTERCIETHLTAFERAVSHHATRA